jgi:sugar lactone lactonase YvrE
MFIPPLIFFESETLQSFCFWQVAGNGAEENRNTSYPAKASFAQPSGIAFDRMSGLLYVADSESSSVRSVNLENGPVKGVCGGSKNPLDLVMKNPI